MNSMLTDKKRTANRLNLMIIPFWLDDTGNNAFAIITHEESLGKTQLRRNMNFPVSPCVSFTLPQDFWRFPTMKIPAAEQRGNIWIIAPSA